MSTFFVGLFLWFIIKWLAKYVIEYADSKRHLRNYRNDIEQLVEIETDTKVLDETGRVVDELDTIEVSLIKEPELDAKIATQEEKVICAMADPDEVTREQAYQENFWSEANYLKRKGKREEYEKKLIEGMSLNETNEDILKALADYYFTYNQTKKALPLLKKIIDSNPNDHKVLWQIAEIYLESWDLETSELLTTKALSISNQNPKYAITLTEIYYNTGRLDDAIVSMEEVVKRRPSHVGYREALAKLYEEADEVELAQECYQAIIEIDPNNVKAKKKSLELRNKL